MISSCVLRFEKQLGGEPRPQQEALLEERHDGLDDDYFHPPPLFPTGARELF
jgi:hypothetical protein